MFSRIFLLTVIFSVNDKSSMQQILRQELGIQYSYVINCVHIYFFLKNYFLSFLSFFPSMWKGNKTR